MKNLISVYNTYTPQRGPDDCGHACLSMLLNYTGRYAEGERLMLENCSPPGGSSLFELRGLLSSYGINARNVSMDLITLRELNVPCILHTVTADGEFHFMVCYGAKCNDIDWEYLIADPATGISWCPENEIGRLWKSGAALYPEGLQFKFPKVTDLTWNVLFRSASLPRILFVSIPFLNLWAALFGIALSWLLQRGMNNSLSDSKSSLLFAVVLLLLLIMLAKGLGNYIRQQMLIKLNAGIRRKYMAIFIGRLINNDISERSLKKGLDDVQMIQNAFSALFGILFSDGSLVIILLIGLCYFEPFAGLINVLYVILIGWRGAVNAVIIAINQRSLADKAATNEISLAQVLKSPRCTPDPLVTHIEEEHRYTNTARSLATLINKQNFFYECLGNFSVISVLSCCLFYVRNNMISYNMLITEVVTSYFVTMLMPRICHSFPVITAGAQLMKKFQVK
ncbi:cysteine peptidase family C39 domain-containing protein [Mucilaginibacter lutimaris]|uniref:Cysteine peptidase family C39 domain-containing protein n=1 Tax=Mucilaginibacter lutimaris TaxID=931629 RepID=A0ABW2ZEF6_9SPHI